MPKFAKAAKFTQNPPKLPNIAQMAKKIQILPKGQICLQKSLKIWPKLGKSPKLKKIAKFVQNCPSGPKTAKLAKNAENTQILARSPAPLHTMI